jgi:ABC transporter with metal-binding/Fe-S-binding domain ATP-binding protein
MRLGILFSGGKDSCLALSKAMKEHEVVCLISIISENKESFMFHTPNIWITKMQAESIGIPLISIPTKGKKEDELKDLEKAIKKAKQKYFIEGIVTGAVKSNYQTSRIQKICEKINLKCINPLWHMDEVELLNDVVDSGIKAIISGVFAFPIEKEMLGKLIDKELIKRLIYLNKKYSISPAGEGGEFETTVLDAPFFKKRIEPLDVSVEYENYSGVFNIKKARLVESDSNCHNRAIYK